MLNFYDPTKNFLGVENPTLAKSNAILIPFGYEKTVSYGKGTSKGPEEILKASRQLELYDEHFKCEPFKTILPLTLKKPYIPKKEADGLMKLKKIVEQVLNLNKFPLILGGEHTITSTCIEALLKKEKSLTILQFDAHADLRNSYENNHYSHACAMRRCLDNKNIDLISIGVRSMSKYEAFYCNKNKKRITSFLAQDIEKWNLKKLERKLKDRKVYITFDIDAFDSSLMPATGTPEPGGLFWNDVIKVLEVASRSSKIYGADICELSPIKSMHSCNFLAAKLAYKILSYSLLKN